MKLALGILMLFAANTWAADSAWLNCDDGKLILNVFEHRAEDGMNRNTELTLIYGMHVYEASMASDDPGSQPDADGFQSVWINGSAENSDEFHGKIKIDYTVPSVKMIGEAWFSETRYDIDSTLNCKEMGRL